MVNKYRERRDLFVAGLNDFLVAAVPGDPFCPPGYIRMSFVTSREVIQKGLKRLRGFVAALG